MAKKKCDCPPPGAPAWMATFGDMMSLLLTFFILLVSFSSIQETKFHEAVGSLQGALGVLAELPKVPVKEDVDRPQERGQQQEDALRQSVEELRKQIKIIGDDALASISQSEKGLAIRLNDQLLFAAGQARVREDAYPLLDLVAETLAGHPQDVRIEGHTDDRPMSSSVFPSNWELSSARAASVLRHFENRGVDPRRLSAVGLGEWRPVASNESPAGRAKNRRVEIFMETASAERPERLGEHY